MKNYRQLTLILFFVTLLLNGCNSRPHYEKAIDKWLYENLNDYSSYEPMEFQVLSHVSDLRNTFDLFEFENVIQRKYEIASQIDMKLNKENKKDIFIETGFSKDLEILLKILIEQNWSINQINSINKRLDQKFEELINLTSDIKDVEYQELLIQFEGVSNRYKVEFEKLKEKFRENGIDIQNIDTDIKEGRYVQHRFRAKNAFGGSMIHSLIFILDEEKENVERVINSDT